MTQLRAGFGALLPFVALGLVLTMASSATQVAETPGFAMAHPSLFSEGGTFVNAWADYDGDGDLDLFVGFDGSGNRLYSNDGGGFTDVAATAGIADRRATRAAAWGDADADGDPDLLVGFTPAGKQPPADATTAASRSVLRFYRNTRGTFRDDTERVGLVVESGAVRQPAWVDVDRDGDLDLFVAFRDKPNALFRNDGDRFVDVAASVGLADPRRTVGAVWFDHDDDGDLDVLVGNMDGDANGLFSQQDGRFTDVASSAAVAWGGRTPNDKSNGTVRPCAGDVDGDGRLDLFFANYGRNGLFLNRGGGRFEDASSAWGIDIDARYDTCALADMNNDGALDVYVNGTVTGGKNYADYLFRNAGTRFVDVSPPEIGSPRSDHGAQWADFDGDGAVDLALTGVEKTGMHWLLRNTLAPALARRGLSIRVLDERGRATLAGVSVTVQTGEDTRAARMVRLVDGGSGYNSQNDAPIHVVVPDGPRVALRISVRRGAQMVAGPLATIDTTQLRNSVYEYRMPAASREGKWVESGEQGE